MFSPPTNIYTVSTVLFYKYGGSYVAVKNCISCFSMFVPTNFTVNSDNGNMLHAQGIGIISCHFYNFSIIYPVGPVYYCLGCPSNTISVGALKCFAGFQKFAFEPLEHCEFVDPQGHFWRLPYQTQNIIYYLQIKIVKFNPHRNSSIFVPTFCALSKQNLSQLIHKCFSHVYIAKLKLMAIKGLMEGLLQNIPDLE